MSDDEVILPDDKVSLSDDENTDDEVVVITKKIRTDKRKADRNSQINKHTCPRGHALSQGTADGSCCLCDECGKRIRVAYAISCSLCAYDMCLQCLKKPKKVRGGVPAVKDLAAKGPAAKGPAGAAGKDGAVGKQGASGKDHGVAGKDGAPGKDARSNDGTPGPFDAPWSPPR